MSPKQFVDHGNKFPFDAPDEWWNSDDDIDPPPPEEFSLTKTTIFANRDWAHSAARGIVASLQDRRGIKNELARELAEDIRKEIIREIAEVIRQSEAFRP